MYTSTQRRTAHQEFRFTDIFAALLIGCGFAISLRRPVGQTNPRRTASRAPVPATEARPVAAREVTKTDTSGRHMC